MRKKLRVGLIFGGKSAEHIVSIQSAKNVFRALDPNKYITTLIGIDTRGKWHYYPENNLLQSTFKMDSIIRSAVMEVSLVDLKFDVVIPIIHGPYGEDGSIQGLFKILNVPFVGSSVLGSAIGMDKDITKRLLRDAGIPIVEFSVYKKNDLLRFEEITGKFGLPFFIKPANLGSSIGVSKIKTKKDFYKAIKNAFEFDNKILIEKYIKGREIECSVLGNDNPNTSIPGEVLPTHDFYDYDAKYIDENGAKLQIPANLSKKQMKRVQELALQTFKVLCLEGMARVDMFLAENDLIYINEVNTIPGFTNNSMYPKLWEASGLAYDDLIDTLIRLAIERFKKEQKLKTVI